MRNKVINWIIILASALCSVAILFMGINLLNHYYKMVDFSYLVYSTDGENNVQSTEGGTVSMTLNGEAFDFAVNKDHEFVKGDIITLTAQAKEGYEFAGFYGPSGFESPSSSETVFDFHMEGSLHINALFAKVYEVSLNLTLEDGSQTTVSDTYRVGEEVYYLNIIEKHLGPEYVQSFFKSAPLDENGERITDQGVINFTMGKTATVVSLAASPIDLVGFSGGAGTSSNPYLISNANDLKQFSSIMGTSSYRNKYYKLTKSINLNEGLTSVTYNASTGYIECIFNEVTYYLGTGRNSTTKGSWKDGKAPQLNYWTPVYNFTGLINGDNKCIGGLCINSPNANNMAFISTVHKSGVGVQNLSTRNGFIIGQDYTAGFVSSSSGSGVGGQGLLNRNIIVGRNHVAGVVGYHNCKDYINCENYGVIISSGSNCGGIAADSAHCGIINCGNYGDIYGNAYVGGLLGRENSGCNCSGFKVQNSVNSGKVYGNSYVYLDFGWKVYGSGSWYRNLFTLNQTSGATRGQYSTGFTLSTARNTLNTLNSWSGSGTTYYNWFLGAEDGLPHIIQNKTPEVQVSATRATVEGGNRNYNFNQTVTLKITPNKNCVVTSFKINGYMKTLSSSGTGTLTYSYTEVIMEDWYVEVVAIQSDLNNLVVDGSTLKSLTGNGTLTFTNLNAGDSGMDETMFEYYINVYDFINYDASKHTVTIPIDKLNFVNKRAVIPSVLYNSGKLYIDTASLIGTQYQNKIKNITITNGTIGTVDVNGETTLVLETGFAVYGVTINGSGVYPTIYSYQAGSLVANGTTTGSAVAGKKVYFMLTAPNANTMPKDIDTFDCVILLMPQFGYAVSTVKYSHYTTSNKQLASSDYGVAKITNVRAKITVNVTTVKTSAEPTKVRVTMDPAGGTVNGKSSYAYDTVVGNTYGGINIYPNLTSTSVFSKLTYTSGSKYSRITIKNNTTLYVDLKKPSTRAEAFLPYDKSLSATIPYTIVMEVLAGSSLNASNAPTVTIYDPDPNVSSQLVTANGKALTQRITTTTGKYFFTLQGTTAKKSYFFAPYFTCPSNAEAKLNIRFSIIMGTIHNTSAFSYISTGQSLSNNLFTATRPGCDFDSWTTMFGDKITSSSYVQISTNHTIQAKYVSKSYKLLFDTNSGGAASCSPTSKTVSYENYYGELPTPYWKGRTFLGWFTSASGGTQVTATDYYRTVGDLTLYAHWKLNTSKLTYYNEQTALGTSTHTYNIQESLLSWSSLKGTVAQNYKNVGWNFAGWTDVYGGTTVKYTDGQKYTTPDDGRAVSMYAVYSRTITFKSNYGGATTNKTITQYWNSYASNMISSVTVPTMSSLMNWTPLAWAPSTWSTLTTNDEKYKTFQSYTITGGVKQITPKYLDSPVFYGVYQRTLTFYSGSNTMSSATVAYNQYLNCAENLLSTVLAPTPEGESLASYGWYVYGWRSDVVAEDRMYESGSPVGLNYAVNEITYYALYARDVTFTYYYGSYNPNYPESNLNCHGFEIVEIQQYLNTYRNTISTLKPKFVKYDLVDNWRFLGYRTDLSAELPTITESKPVVLTLAYNSRVLDYNYYAIYQRDYTATFYSGENNSTSYPVSVTRYYNSGTTEITCPNYELPLTLPVHTPSEAQCRSVEGWIKLGWRGDDTAEGAAYPFDTVVWIPFELVKLYAVYSFSYTANFYSGVQQEKLDQVDATIYHNANTENAPGGLSIITPSFESCKPIEYWTPIGYRIDSNNEDKIYGFGETISIPKDCVDFYAVYMHHYDAAFISGENKEQTVRVEQTLYYNTCKTAPVTTVTIQTPRADNTLCKDIEFWTKTGWRDDENVANKEYDFDSEITISIHTITFYASYLRDFTANFHSGTNMEQNVPVHAETTYFSSVQQAVPITVQIIAPGVQYAVSISNWRSEGWNDDQDAEEPRYAFNTRDDFYFHITEYYAIYSRVHYVTFYSGKNNEDNDIREAKWYYNSSVKTVPTTAKLKTLAVSEISEFDNAWTNLGFRTDTQDNAAVYGFEQDIEIPFTVTVFYAVYSYSYRATFYSGEYQRGQTNYETEIYYNTNSIRIPTQVEINIPSASNTYDIDGWVKLGYRSDTENRTQAYNFGDTRYVALTEANFYTVYSSSYTGYFFSGANKSKRTDVSTVAYYNSFNKDKSSSVTINFPSANECDALVSYTKLGWRGDHLADEPEFAFGEEVAVNFDVTEFYAVYAYNSSMLFKSGLNLSREERIDIRIYSNTFDTTPPVSTVITMPDESECEDIPNWTKNGWRIDANPQQAIYNFGERYDNIILDTVFYAVYKRDLVVNYNSGSAEGTTQPTVLPVYLNTSAIIMSSQEVTLAECAFTKTGYSFTYWAEGRIDGPTYEAGVKFSPDIVYSANSFEVQMYALWEGNPYQIAYYNGTSLITDSSHIYGTASPLKTWAEINIREINSNVGWVFAGWSLSPTSATVDFLDGVEITDVTVESVCNIYAVYSRTITFRGGHDAGSVLDTKVQYWNPFNKSNQTNVTFVYSPAIPNVLDWVGLGFRQDILASNSNLFEMETDIYPEVDKQENLYSVYSRTIVFWSSAGEAGLVLDSNDQKQYMNTYNNIVSTITTASPMEEGLAPFGFEPLGYREDDQPTNIGTVGTNTPFAPNYESSNQFYAVYQRIITDIYISGVNESSVINKEGYQYFNCKNVLVSEVTLEYVEPTLIDNWVALGYRVDTTSDVASITSAVTKKPSYLSNNITTNYYAVYKRTYQAKFYMGINSSAYIEREGFAFYNTVLESLPETVTITIPDSVVCTDVMWWEKIGFRTDRNTKQHTHNFLATYTNVPFGTDFYLVYQRILSIVYNGNDNTGGETANTTKIIYASAGSDTSSSQEVKLSECGFVKRGHSFVSWLEGSTTGTEYQKNSFYNPQLNFGDFFTITMYAKWEINPYTITFVAGSGIANVEFGAWLISGKTVSKDILYNTEINLNLATITHKSGYDGIAWVLEAEEGSDEMNQFDQANLTYVVTDKNVTFVVNATNLAAPTVSISGGTTQVYGASDITLTYSNTTLFDPDVTIYYKLGISVNTLEDFSFEGQEYTSSSELIISKTSHVGSRYYKVKAYATNGVLTSEETTSENSTNIELLLTELEFDASLNGGTVYGGAYVVYAKYGTANVYAGPVSEYTVDIASAAKTGYTFTGWHTASDANGILVINSEGLLQENIEGYTNELGQFIKVEKFKLYAHFVQNNYTVSYHANGGTGSMSSHGEVYDEEFVLSLNEFSRVGYHFGTWNTDINGAGNSYTDGQTTSNLTPNPNETVVLYAQWIPNIYTISFDTNQGDPLTETLDVTFDSPYGTLPVPTREFYTFVCWTVSDGTTTTELTEETPVTTPSNHTLVAKWQLNRSKVFIDPNGGTYIIQGEFSNEEYDSVYEYPEQEYNTTLTLNIPVKNGYTFTGWYLLNLDDPDLPANGSIDNLTNTYTFGPKNNAQDLLSAQWEENTYSIIFNKNAEDATGEMAEQFFTYDFSDQLLSECAFEKTGYLFKEWNLMADGTGESFIDKQEIINLSTVPNDVITFYAIWEPIIYKVEFNTNGAEYFGSSLPTQNFIYDTPQNLAENVFQRTGYSFGGWNLKGDATGRAFADKELVQNLSTVNGDTVVLYAIWLPKVVKITLNNQDSLEDNFTFSYFYYRFQTAEFFLNEDCTEESKIESLTPPSRHGYDFNGFFTEALQRGTQYINYRGELINNIQNFVSSDAILYASWTAHTYSVFYVPNGAYGSIQEQIYEYDEPVSLISVFSYTGYTFLYWTNQVNNEQYFETDIISNLCDAEDGTELAQITLVANWTPNHYTVKFVANYEGSEFEDITQEFIYSEAQDLTENTFTREGYKFSHWNTRADGDSTSYQNKENVIGLTFVPDDIVTLYAQWEPLQYTITLDAGRGTFSDGTSTKELTVTYGERYGTLPVPTASNATCIYWIDPTNNGKIDSTTLVKITQDTTIYGKWVGSPYNFRVEQSHIEVYLECDDTKTYLTNANGTIYGQTAVIITFTVEEGYTAIELNISGVHAMTMTEIMSEGNCLIPNKKYQLTITDVAGNITIRAIASMSVPDGLKFEVNTSTREATVIGYEPPENAAGTIITIPTSISLVERIDENGSIIIVPIAGDAYNVVAIGPYAFSKKTIEVDENGAEQTHYSSVENIREIIIPDSIKLIAEGAFTYVRNIEKFALLGTSSISIATKVFPDPTPNVEISLYVNNAELIKTIGLWGESYESAGGILTNVVNLYIPENISEVDISTHITSLYDITSTTVTEYGTTYILLVKKS